MQNQLTFSKSIIIIVEIIILTKIFLNFTWILFVNKQICNCSYSLTVTLSVVEHITRDVCKTSYGFSLSLLRIQNM